MSETPGNKTPVDKFPGPGSKDSCDVPSTSSDPLRREPVIIDKVKDGIFYIFQCPHCNAWIMVKTSEVNCRIFRHATEKKTFNQINPHTPKKQCDEVVDKQKVYGCAKPFRFVVDANGKYWVEKCGYI